MAFLKENYEDSKTITKVKYSASATEFKLQDKPPIIYVLKKVNDLEKQLDEIEQCESYKETGKLCPLHQILFTILKNEKEALKYLFNMSIN